VKLIVKAKVKRGDAEGEIGHWTLDEGVGCAFELDCVLEVKFEDLQGEGEN
jgi:hypothetical protein